MSIFYSGSTGGFYDTTIHASLFVECVDLDPETGETLGSSMVPDPHGPIADAIEITTDEHRALLDAQAAGKIITTDPDGRPVAADPPPPSSEQLAEAARQQRDRLLRECDWTVLSDVPLAEADRTAWQTYRQSLRDVPGQAGFPTTITWPTVP